MDMMARIFNLVTGPNIFYELAIPWALFYFVIYVGLIGANLFTQKSRKIIAGVIAAMMVFPHLTNTYPPCWDVVEIILEVMPWMGFMVLSIIAVIVVLGLIGIQSWNESVLKFVGFFTIFYVIWHFISARGGPNYMMCPGWSIFQLIASDTGVLLFSVGAIILFVYFFVRSIPGISNDDDDPYYRG